MADGWLGQERGAADGDVGQSAAARAGSGAQQEEWRWGGAAWASWQGDASGSFAGDGGSDVVAVAVWTPGLAAHSLAEMRRSIWSLTVTVCLASQSITAHASLCACVLCALSLRIADTDCSG